ncbi:MAG: hydroxyacid-oxoacid transhydrogenase [Candidatus Latescibacteria bacterium]|jgi:hydroxyacid-oxoacid transhydrogenase|nr:hydroxyacid-oxoacid transhydrogenase [Candidatus Latescibacterota bacterium]
MNSEKDYAFQMSASNLRFGSGTTREIGMDLADMGIKRVLVVTDPNLVNLPPVQTAREALESEGIEYDLFDRARVEPTDVSFKDAIQVAVEGNYEAYVAIGGGSSIDTAKAANLFATYPDDFFAYINAPIGQGKPVPGPVKPLFAIPTTAGTGSETTGVAIMDLSDRHVKTGIAHRYLKPDLAIVDPENTRTMPASIAAATGLDVLCHALESFTTLPFTDRPKPNRPIERPAYQGTNPISDIWALKAIEMTTEYLPRAVRNPDDDEARGQMILAASLAGIGFGNAGVHLCHGMSYPVSGMVRDFKPEGMITDHAIVPHGMSVVLNAPPVFRFTGPARPDRHLQAAQVMGADISNASPDEAGHILADQIVSMMKILEVPNGLSAIGFTEDDIPTLVEGTLPQHRVTKLSPRPAEAEDLEAMFKDAMVAW